MIGIELVFSKDKIISEFFELFKTPWEYIKPNRTYAVIISDQAQPSMLEARLVIIIHRGEDSTSEKAGAKPSKSILLRSGDTTFPIYLGIRKIMDGSPLINIEKTGECVGSYICNKGKIILHLGYDYFEEACYQLIEGQPLDYACFPTLDIHIANLRSWILKAGIPMIEIPPVAMEASSSPALSMMLILAVLGTIHLIAPWRALFTEH